MTMTMTYLYTETRRHRVYVLKNLLTSCKATLKLPKALNLLNSYQGHSHGHRHSHGLDEIGKIYYNISKNYHYLNILD